MDNIENNSISTKDYESSLVLDSNQQNCENVQTIKKNQNIQSQYEQSICLSDETMNQQRRENNDDQVQEQQQHEQANFKWLFQSCFEMALSFVIDWMPYTATLYFISSNSSENIVNGFGLGLVWSNCIGQGLLYGLGSGLETMASHAHGAHKYKQVGQLFNKAVLLSFIVFVVILFAMIFSESILGLWNSNKDVCSIAAEYCQLIIPGLFIVIFYYVIKATLNAVNEYRIQVYISAINLATHLIYCFIFIKVLDLKIKGAAIVFCLWEIQTVVMQILVVIYKKKVRKCFVKPTLEVFNDFFGYLKIVIPIGAIVGLEWIIQEVTSIIASNLSEAQYSAHIIIAQISMFCYQFLVGYSTASCTFIGNEMGKKNVANAKKYTIYTIYIILGHLAIVILPLALLKKQIAEFFTDSSSTIDAIESVYYWFIAVFLIQSFTSLMGAYMRAIAQEKFCSFVYLTSSGVIGISASYSLAYPADLKLDGIWIGQVIAVGVFLLAMIIQAFRVDINKMAIIISKRLEEENAELQKELLENREEDVDFSENESHKQTENTQDRNNS
ncbi:hypothetical protein ABPG72_022455 [Tetrahymena utriculariae]